MIWFVLGSFCLCGGVLLTVRDTRADGDRPFVDRAPLRRLGGGMLGVAGTILLGYLILTVLATWVSSDL